MFAGEVLQYFIIRVQLFSEPVCLGHGFHNHKCFSAPRFPSLQGRQNVYPELERVFPFSYVVIQEVVGYFHFPK